MDIEYRENNNDFVVKIIKYVVKNYEYKINTEVIYEIYNNYSIGGYEKSVYFSKIPTIEEIINKIKEEENY